MAIFNSYVSLPEGFRTGSLILGGCFKGISYRNGTQVNLIRPNFTLLRFGLVQQWATHARRTAISNHWNQLAGPGRRQFFRRCNFLWVPMKC